jgi:hypothetical protein
MSKKMLKTIKRLAESSTAEKVHALASCWSREAALEQRTTRLHGKRLRGSRAVRK